MVFTQRNFLKKEALFIFVFQLATYHIQPILHKAHLKFFLRLLPPKRLFYIGIFVSVLAATETPRRRSETFPVPSLILQTVDLTHQLFSLILIFNDLFLEVLDFCFERFPVFLKLLPFPHIIYTFLIEILLNMLLQLGLSGGQIRLRVVCPLAHLLHLALQRLDLNKQVLF